MRASALALKESEGVCECLLCVCADGRTDGRGAAGWLAGWLGALMDRIDGWYGMG